MKLSINNEIFEYDVISMKNDEIIILLEGKEYKINAQYLSEASSRLELNKKSHKVFHYLSDGLELSIGPQNVFIEKIKNNTSQSGGMSEDVITSPMPGKVFKVQKSVGDEVKIGETVIVLEAMKMEHELKASMDGKIKTLNFKVGDQVSHGDIIVEFES